MTVAPQVVRQRIATALAAVSGWAEFAGVPSRFPAFAARPISHKHFSVDMPTVDIEEGRQLAIGMPLWEGVIVRWSFLLRASHGRDDYDAALVEEAKLVAALRFTTGDQGPVVRLTGIARAPISDGTYLLGTITANAWHHYPMT